MKSQCDHGFSLSLYSEVHINKHTLLQHAVLGPFVIVDIHLLTQIVRRGWEVKAGVLN